MTGGGESDLGPGPHYGWNFWKPPLHVQLPHPGHSVQGIDAPQVNANREGVRTVLEGTAGTSLSALYLPTLRR